ncbi:hypothetical protein ACKKBF_B17870 [Auxenochlorella protothecoides x Auxenochlorella symbiontica]
MYPTVSFDAPTYSSSDYSWVPAPSTSVAGARSNGSGKLESASSSQPTLRVVIAEPFRIAPPVRVSPKLQAVLDAQPSTSQPPIRRNPSNRGNFDYEQGVLRQVAEASARSQAPGPASPSTQGPCRTEAAKYEGMGFAPLDVALAAAVAGQEQAHPDLMAQTCRAVADLRSMGFDPVRVAGALSLHKGDVSAATEACLSAAGAGS